MVEKMKEPKKTKPKVQNIDFPFYVYLELFLKEERKRIYSSYTPLTRKFLHFNNPENPSAYLRKPQFEALEMYVFLKEFCHNKFLYQIFEDWFYKKEEFTNRKEIGIDAQNQLSMFGPSEVLDTTSKELFKAVFEGIQKFQQIYPNYIFALTMGLGKTVLMATSIFYEFLLANKFPNDERFCHNALVFAPDKTVLQSLKEIQTFDFSKVVPPEYVSWIETNTHFFFLDETGDALNAIDNSKFNIIISNTQKIILKKKTKTKTGAQELFESHPAVYKAKSSNQDYLDLYGFDLEEVDLITNQRFAKLTRFKQLGIYVDEAHHVFGSALAADFGLKQTATSLRVTINELAENLKQTGTKVVGCYNYTGTPFVGSRLLPEVVYAYGLKDAIQNRYLKKVKISGFENIKDQTVPFIRLAIQEFWTAYNGRLFEGLLPKIAFFASTIEELQLELKPAVEQVLSEMGISTEKILVNVGDSSITTNDDIREFKNLDTPQSDKQFILLVNKGKEGWNCRSLFGVGLHREPKSKVFVLQATMRCLRQITSYQETGLVFLSDENVKTLEAELQENFRLSVDDLNNTDDGKETVEVRIVPPPIKVKLNLTRKLHQLKEKKLKEGIDLELEKVDTGKYKILRSERSIHDIGKKISADRDVTYIKEKRTFSELTLVAEIAKYLNISPLKINHLLSSTKQGTKEILKSVNEFNELLYDWVIPHLFKELYEIIEFKTKEEVEIELVKPPKEGDSFRMRAKKELVAKIEDSGYAEIAGKSFHLDRYCFDSIPEKEIFEILIHDSKVEGVWFTGMLTHGQTDFFINYIEPDSNTLRSYYPDFLIKLTNGTYQILEIKADYLVDDSVVRAKAEYASQLANSNAMEYKLLKSSEILHHSFKMYE